MKPELSVVDLPRGNLADVPERLRAIAARIEAGEFGAVDACAVVLQPEQRRAVEIFGIGRDGNSLTVHFMLCCAQRIIEQPAVDGEI